MTDTTSASTDADIKAELRQTAAEPLLPVEKKLIGWSLGTGLVLLVLLFAVTRWTG